LKNDELIKISSVESSEPKEKICEKILRALPQWFGIESAILDYIRDVQSMPMYVAEVESELAGFVSLKEHTPQAAEVYVMGVLSQFHRRKVGRLSLEHAEKDLSHKGFQYLTVKTLSPSRVDEYYDRTRRFYLARGFTPVEEFKTLWGKHNPCLFLVKKIDSEGEL
jgi:ribosomal protein S18 acetylase RimI-like enzyme